MEYYPDHNGDSFYIRVNDTGRNFRLVKRAGGRSGEQELARNDGAQPDVMLDDVDFFKNFYVLYERETRAAADPRDRFAQREVAADCVSGAGVCGRIRT